MLSLPTVEIVSAGELQLSILHSVEERDELRGSACVGVLMVRWSRSGRTHHVDPTVRRAGTVGRPGSTVGGQLLEPSPAVLLNDPVALPDAQGNPIRVLRWSRGSHTTRAQVLLTASVRCYCATGSGGIGLLLKGRVALPK